MTVLSLSSANALYACARARTIAYHTVENSAFHRLCCASRQLERIAGDRADEDILRPLARDARRLRFELSTAPLPFNDPFVCQRLSGADYFAIAQKVRLIYPGVADVALEIAEGLSATLASQENPLLTVIEGLGREHTTLVVRKSRLVDAVQQVLRATPATTQIEVSDLESIRSTRTFGRLIICGPAHWYPDHVFSAPRAADIQVVSYRWQRSDWQPQAAFVAAAQREPVTVRRPVMSSVGDDLAEPWPELDWDAISRNALVAMAGPGTQEAHDAVEARLFLLRGGLAVFLDCQSSALVIDVDADGDDRVKRVSCDDIEPGTHLLLRTEGGGDYIVPLANQVLGNRAEGHRAMQRHWKERLRQVAAESPEPDVRGRLMDVSLRLIDLGATRADEWNLRHWMSMRNIATRDLQHFRAIMGLVGLASEADRYWSVMRQILAAHHQAGRRIRRRLLERVRRVDMRSQQRAARIDFALPEEEGGMLSAFFVEGRAPNRSHVPVAKEGHLFERED